MVLRADRKAPGRTEEARGTIGVRAGTTFVETARTLASEREDLRVVVYENAITNDAVLDSVLAGRVDYTIQDSNRLNILLE